MNEDHLERDAAKPTSKVESLVGRALKDGHLETNGATHQLEGQAQAAIGAAQDVVSKIADTAHAAISKVSEQVGQVAGRASDTLKNVKGRVDPFVQSRPYAAAGMAAGVGLVLGLMLAGRGPKTIYVRARD